MSQPTAIRELRFFSARSTLSRPIADATHTIPAIEFIVGEVERGAKLPGLYPMNEETKARYEAWKKK